MLRLTTINKAIKAEGIDLELVRGEGYFYVVGPYVEHLTDATVYCYTLNQQPLEAWLVDVRGFARKIEEYRAELVVA